MPGTSSRRPNQIINYPFRPNLLIVLFESLDTDMLTAFDILDKGIDFSTVNDELVLEVTANKAFFKENISFSVILDSDFDLNSDNSNSNQNNSNFNENNSTKSAQDKDKSLQYICNYYCFNGCNSSYA